MFITKTEAEGDFQEREKRAALGGLVPADMTYPEWIAKQSAAFQDKAFGGKGKASLFRSLLKKRVTTESPCQICQQRWVGSNFEGLAG